MLIALSVIVGLAILVFLLSPRGLQRLYSPLIFEPTRVTKPYDLPRFSGITAKDVWLRGSWGRKLHGWFFLNPASDVVILFNHSNAGNVDEWCPLIAELLATGASVLAYDYQGYGLSQGCPTVRGVCRDGHVAYDYVTRELGFAPGKVIVYGSSLGTGVACDVAARHPVGALVLHGGFSSLRQVSVEMLPATRFVPDFLFFRPRMDNAALLKRITVPLRVVHGQYDEMFDRYHPLALFETAASPDKRLIILPGCGHMQRDQNHQQAVLEVVEALSRPSRA